MRITEEYMKSAIYLHLGECLGDGMIEYVKNQPDYDEEEISEDLLSETHPKFNRLVGEYLSSIVPEDQLCDYLDSIGFDSWLDTLEDIYKFSIQIDWVEGETPYYEIVVEMIEIFRIFPDAIPITDEEYEDYLINREECQL